MSRNIVSIDIRFAAAHRLMDYVGKCACLHGHSYKATVTVSSAAVDKQGFVVDFGVLRKPIKEWIDRHFDHNALLRIDDPLANYLASEYAKSEKGNGGKIPHLMADNPTAENIAFEIRKFVLELLDTFNTNKEPTDPRFVRLESVSVNEEEGTMACVREVR